MTPAACADEFTLERLWGIEVATVGPTSVVPSTGSSLRGRPGRTRSTDRLAAKTPVSRRTIPESRRGHLKISTPEWRTTCFRNVLDASDHPVFQIDEEPSPTPTDRC
jgi:hypothetical protein